MTEYYDIIVWTALFIIFVGSEVVSLGLTTIWFAIGSVAGLVCAALDLPIWVQGLAFFAVSIVTLIFTRPIAKRHLSNKISDTNIDSLLGKEGIVTEDIDNLQSTGTVALNGLEWSARTENNGVVIEKNSKVRVKNIEGVKLIVEAI